MCNSTTTSWLSAPSRTRLEPIPSLTPTAARARTMTADRRLAIVFACVLIAACGDGKPVASADCIKVVEESGQSTDECLRLAPESDRVDLATPSFNHPTQITNRLHPTSNVTQVIMGGHVEGK